MKFSFLSLLACQMASAVAVSVSAVDSSARSIRAGADRNSAAKRQHSAADVASVLKLTELFKTPKHGERLSSEVLSKIEESLVQMASHSVPDSTVALLDSILTILDQQMKVAIRDDVAINRAKILNSSSYLSACADTASGALSQSRQMRSSLPGLKADFHTCVNSLPPNLSDTNVDSTYVNGPSGYWSGGRTGTWNNTPDCIENADLATTTTTTTGPDTGLAGGATVPVTIAGSGCCNGVYVYDNVTGTWITNHAGNPNAPGSYNVLTYANGCWTISSVTTSSGANGTTVVTSTTLQLTATCPSSSSGTVSDIGQITSWTSATNSSTVTLSLQQAASSVEELPAVLNIAGSHDENVLGNYIIQPMVTGPATIDSALYYAAVWKKMSNGAELKWDPSSRKWAVTCAACGLASGCSTLLESIATSEVSPLGVSAWYVGSTNASAAVQITKVGSTLAVNALQALKLAGTASIDGISYVSGIYLRVNGSRVWQKAGNSNLEFCGTQLTSKWHVIDLSRSAELLYTASSQWVSLPQNALIWGPNYTSGSAATVTQATMAETLQAIAEHLAGNCSACADGSDGTIESLPTDCTLNQTTISATGGSLSTGGAVADPSFPPSQLALQGASTVNQYLAGRYTRDPADSTSTTEKWKRCSTGGPEIVYDSSSLRWEIRSSGSVLFRWTAAVASQVPTWNNPWTGVAPQTQDAGLRVTQAVCVGSCSSTEQCTFVGDRNHPDCINAVAVCTAFERFDSLDAMVGSQYQINANDADGVNPATQKCLKSATAGGGSHPDFPPPCAFWEDLNVGNMPPLPSPDCDSPRQDGNDPARPDQNRPLTLIDLTAGDYFATMKDYWQDKITEWDAKWAACQAARNACSARTGVPAGPFPVDSSFSSLSDWNATAREDLRCVSTTTTTSVQSTTSVTTVPPTPSPSSNPTPSPTLTPTPSPTLPSPMPSSMPSPAPAPTPVPTTTVTTPTSTTTTTRTTTTTSSATTTTTAPRSGECGEKQDRLDNVSCEQGKIQIEACKEYDCCYDYVNASLYQEWDPICRTGGILDKLRAEYLLVLHIDCLINALKQPDATRNSEINNCTQRATTPSSYQNELLNVSIAECSWTWPQKVNYAECSEAGTLNPTTNGEISGTLPYVTSYYGALSYYKTCSSSCCYNLPDPPSPTCPDACACGKAVPREGTVVALAQEGTHQTLSVL